MDLNGRGTGEQRDLNGYGETVQSIAEVGMDNDLHEAEAWDTLCVKALLSYSKE